MKVENYEHLGKKYMVFIANTYQILVEMRRTCKGRTWINSYDAHKWQLTEQLL